MTNYRYQTNRRQNLLLPAFLLLLALGLLLGTARVQAASLARPEDLSVKTEVGRNTVTWSAVSGADYYVITRKSVDERYPVEYGPIFTERWVDEDILAGMSYTYSVCGILETDTSSLTGPASSITVRGKIPTVKLVSVKESGSAIQVTWNPVTLGGDRECGVRVYRKSETSDWKRVATLSETAASWKDTSADTGTWTYRVRAYVMDGTTARYGSYSQEISLTRTMRAPKLLSATAMTGYNRIEWQAVDPADRYYVYRRPAGTTKWTQIGYSSRTYYKDTKDPLPGRLYDYSVKAAILQDGTYVRGALDEEGISVRTQIPTVKLDGTSGSYTITVRWHALANVDGYYIYRKVPGGSWSRIGEMTGASATSYKDTKASEAYTYVYTVRAYVRDGDTVYRGGYDAEGLTKKVSLHAPKILTSTAASGYVNVSWEPTSTAAGYRIYRKTATGSYKRVGVVKDGAQNNWWDTTVPIAVSYTYAVRAYRTVAGTDVVSAASAMTSPVTTRPAEPLILSVKKNTAGTKDTIRWTAVAGVTGYAVYKKNAATGNAWERIASVKPGTTETMSLSTDRYAGGVTIYRVRSYVTKNGTTSYSLAQDSHTNELKVYTKSSILFMGDSITYGKTWGGVSPLTYPDRVASITGAAVTNMSLSGSTLASTGDADTTSRVKAVESGSIKFYSYDVICIAMGTNDYTRGIPLGTLGDSGNTTFYGAWKTVIRKLQKQNPMAQVVLITPNMRLRQGEDYSKGGMQAPNTLGYTLQDYVNVIKDIAARYGLKVYDSLDQGVITRSNASWRLYDSLHPTPETYALMGTSIAEYLKKNALTKNSQK